ncbi:hypothetical protein BURMUCGD1_2075 [Burkholderia multivorans CGD1]|nr:hypothetical protein BURMUCGD1_2075 [Burkholderia multivorans CGD1]
MSAFRPGAPAAARAPLICNWRSYAMGCGVAPPAALVSAFEKLVHMNSMFNMLFFLLFRRRRQPAGADAPHARRLGWRGRPTRRDGRAISVIDAAR